MLDCCPGPLKVSVVGLKPQLAPDGREAQVRETFAPKVREGDTNTEYCAVLPATTVWLEGLIAIAKEVAVNDAVSVLLGFVSLEFVTVASIEPLPAVVGVTAMATVVVDPACSVGMVHATLTPVGTLQVPAPAVALLNVAVIPVESWPVTVIFVAKSGPPLVTVKVMVTWLPALTTPEAGEITGATQVMHKKFAVRSFTANASVLGPLPVPLSKDCNGATVSNVPLLEFVSPAKYVFREESTVMLVPRSVPLPPK
jgi:hypothetical protein